MTKTKSRNTGTEKKSRAREKNCKTSNDSAIKFLNEKWWLGCLILCSFGYFTQFIHSQCITSTFRVLGAPFYFGPSLFLRYIPQWIEWEIRYFIKIPVHLRHDGTYKHCSFLMRIVHAKYSDTFFFLRKKKIRIEFICDNCMRNP